MKTLYVHMGTPKTGTTAIQNFLNDNKERLREFDCCYPVFPVKYKVARKVRNGHWLVNSRITPEEYETCMQVIFDAAEKYSKIVLTDEGIWNHGGRSKKFWTNLKERMAEHDIEVKAVVYLRRQDNYVFSYWSQRVKESQNVSISFEDYIYSGQFQKNYLNYRGYLNSLATVIGKENIIVRAYESGQYEGAANNILSDFLLQLGIPWQEDFKLVKRKNNISMKDSVLEAKRLLNTVPAFMEKNVTLRKYLEQIQAELTEKGELQNRTGFPIRFRKKFLKHYADINAFVAREFMEKENGVLFEEPLMADDEKKAEFSREELVQIYDRLKELSAADEKAVYTPEELAQIVEEALQSYDLQMVRERSLKVRTKRFVRQFRMIPTKN